MTTDAISKIKNVEDSSKERIIKAEAEAKKILEDAVNKSKIRYDEIFEKACNDRDKILEEAKQKGQINSKPIINEAEEKSNEILNISEKKLLDIADSIVERIVMNNGNS
ncbi:MULTISPECIES: V-type sodium ATP synthase subunit G [Peptoniphilus]|uniref:V-type sodium ATP synthase subunit G n=1 Tax=Peptoniphilus TaxID=162289 RepID=UPI0001DAA05B|nr:MULTISPECIES: V-type sodium ATP synthase subunit G [Peptoniphilus]EFI41638.1 hypothetical protein HMPREF0629_00261 [Peptoniphilus sp. oral taxon 386 str. F0131]